MGAGIIAAISDDDVGMIDVKTDEIRDTVKLSGNVVVALVTPVRNGKSSSAKGVWSPPQDVTSQRMGRVGSGSQARIRVSSLSCGAPALQGSG